MVVNKQNIRLIFGLKLKQLRLQKGLSFAQLSKAAGVSVSYLNEIEKGKKYPKTEKIIALAQALRVSYDQLVSLKLNKKLTPIADLLNSGILESLPLEIFGLDPSTLLELISTAPTKINAFISTIIKIARNYEMSQENFYFAALRSYQEMHDNYFEELENSIDAFIASELPALTLPVQPEVLEDILISKYGYTIDKDTLDKDEDLKQFRSVYVPDARKLYINCNLNRTQQAFVLGKELGFTHLGLEDRPTTSTVFEVHSFEEVLNNFKASYAAVALLINRDALIGDLNELFASEVWKPKAFLKIMEKYQASPEMFLHRMSNVLPRYYGIDNFFFLRFHDFLDMPQDNYHITKELHLSQQHNPHRNDLNEHYCRRWVAIRTLEDLKAEGAPMSEPHLIDTQRSCYISNRKEYFCISLAKSNTPSASTNVSVTLGIFIDSGSRKRIKFLDSESIPRKEVNETCERCPLVECEEREVPPTVVARKNQQLNIRRKLADLQDQA